MAWRDDEGLMLGYRFHPTDQDLLSFYLPRKKQGLPCNIIAELQLYNYDPPELPDLAMPLSDREWYFYVPRDPKYCTRCRPNRVAKTGYWKATGSDKRVEHLGQFVGLRKTLVFYAGKAPAGQKTDWIMNEYRLPESSIEEVDMALCKVYRKGFRTQHEDIIYGEVLQERSIPMDMCQTTSTTEQSCSNISVDMDDLTPAQVEWLATFSQWSSS